MMMGTQIGQYRVLQQIGEGGMGVVWLAEHMALGRRAAIKVLHPSFSTRPEIVQRFFNEARAATAISDPGIVQIFDFGQHVDGSAYIVMELLDGETLDRRLRRLGHLGIGDAVRILRMVASSLGAAHARGIVHRDLKPENIFLVRDNEVAGGERAKILDFGIAKLTGDQTNLKTQTSAVMGTPMFMSPEQCRGAGLVDQRSDIYSLGCVLFTVICGRPPFDGEGAGDLIAMHLREPAPHAISVRGDVPPALDALIDRCLAKDPSARFASATDLAQALDAFRTSSSPQLSGQSTQPPHGFVAHAASTTLSSAAGAAASAPAPRSNARIVLALGGVVVAGVVVAAFTLGTGGGKHSDPVAADEPAAPLPARAPAASPPSAPAAPRVAPPPPPEDQVAAPMKRQMEAFTTWAKEHGGAPCPSVADLGDPVLDPWGHALAVTCTDQPGNQIIGLVSAGSDGQPGTADDIGSWSVPAAADLVRGERWKVTPIAKPPIAKPPAAKPPGTKPPGKRGKGTAAGGVEVDENGIPVNR